MTNRTIPTLVHGVWKYPFQKDTPLDQVNDGAELYPGYERVSNIMSESGFTHPIEIYRSDREDEFAWLLNFSIGGDYVFEIFCASEPDMLQVLGLVVPPNMLSLLCEIHELLVPQEYVTKQSDEWREKIALERQRRHEAKSRS